MTFFVTMRILNSYEDIIRNMDNPTRLNNLYRLLMEQNRIDDLQKAIANEEYRSALYAEFNL